MQLIKSYITLLLTVLCANLLFAQQVSFTIDGKVTDQQNNPVQNVIVKVQNRQSVTDEHGHFQFKHLAPGEYKIEIMSFVYKSAPEIITIDNKDVTIQIKINTKDVVLEEVVVMTETKNKTARENSSISYEIDNQYLEANRENSLMQTLSKLPGVSNISIGAGQSKPTIRGLGFNRVAVVQNGIKHQAQEWGSDHGLEIDQYDVGSIQVIKGPASLLCGSDAIGGVINIRPASVPKLHSFSGDVNLLAESNNDLLGISAGVQARNDKWYYRGRLTLRNYGDYKVPTDKIVYQSYVFDLSDHHLRNTAGTEADGSFSFGYIGNHFKSETSLSSVYAKNGFFANVHGLEVRTSQIDYDKSSRDVDLPYHTVNHFKITNNSTYYADNVTWKVNLGYQNNVREEHSEPIAHGYMPKPEGTLDRRFVKNTSSLDILSELENTGNHQLTLGINSEYQHNKIGGWGFLIPAYQKFIVGSFAYDKYEINPNLFLHTGIRYDVGIVHTEAYYDWFTSPVDNRGTTTNEYVQRSQQKTFDFNNVSASVGISYLKAKMKYKLNIGKSFRIPLASELASDGVNYHMFRFERGNANLKAESS